MRLLRFARNDENGVIARPSLLVHPEGIVFSSLRGLFSLVIARLSPSLHCEARSAEAISGSDRPHDEAVGPKGSSLSLRPLRLLRSARNDKKGVIAGFLFWFIPRESYSRHCEAFPLSSLRGTKCRSNLMFSRAPFTPRVVLTKRLKNPFRFLP